MLSTPYYRTFAQISATKCSNMAEPNFDPYLLFCLITQTGTFLAERGRSQDLSCVTREENGHMSLKIQTTLSDEELVAAQDRVDEIISDRPMFCIVYSAKLEREYPQFWTREMLPFISCPPRYNPFVFEDNLYVDLSQEENFMTAYNDLLQNIRDELSERWKEGFVTYASSIALDWSLEAVDVDGNLYRPTWKDDRFASDMVEFLLSRLSGEKEIMIALKPSLPMFHNIASVLQGRNFYFINEPGKTCFIVVTVSNLSEAQNVTGLIEEAAYSVIGEVFTREFSSQQEAETLGENLNSVVYTNLGTLRPFVLSVLQGFNLPSPFVRVP